MKQRNIDTNLYKVYNEVIRIIFLIVAFFKFKAVYEAMRFAGFATIYSILTLSIIGIIYIIINKFSQKAANIVCSLFYTVVSIILFIDCVYFSYMNKFTSISNLKLITFLDEVKESLAKINPKKYLWILYDIPIIMIYSLFVNKKLYIFLSKKIKYDFNIKKIKLVNKIIFLVGIISLVFYGNSIGFKAKYIRTENIIYHVRDFINVTFDFEKDIDFEEFYEQKIVKKDENYGIATDKNVIIIQVEALQNFVVNKEYYGQEITPFLNSLISGDSFYFNNYFYQVGGGNTSDAEFTVNNSLLSTTTDAAYVKYTENEYYGLPHILKDNGYTTANVYHAYNREFWNREVAYENQGFDNYYASGDYIIDDFIGMGLSDESFFKQVANKIEKLQKPFYSFIITLTSHHPFVMPEDKQNIKIDEKHKDSLYGNYLNAVNYTDKALETFFNELKEKGLYENSIFVIYGDHFGVANYNHPDQSFVSDLIGYDYQYKDMMNVPLIIHIPGLEKAETIDTVGAHVDVLPTLLHLLGLENNKSIMLGSDLFSVEENIVYEMTHVGNGSYVTNDYFYYSPISGIDIFNKAYDMKTGKLIEITNEMFEISEKSIEFIKNAKLLLNANKAMREK